jgi:hypothetical protein
MIVQCYAPTNTATTEEKEVFYGLLEVTLHRVKLSDIVILLGDLNAKMGDDNLGLQNVMGRHGLGARNENVDMFIDPSSSSSSSVICQTTGPQPLPKRFLHLMRSRASSFK